MGNPVKMDDLGAQETSIWQYDAICHDLGAIWQIWIGYDRWSILESRTAVWWSNLRARIGGGADFISSKSGSQFNFGNDLVHHPAMLRQSWAGAALPPEDRTGDARGNKSQCHGVAVISESLFFPTASRVSTTFGMSRNDWNWLKMIRNWKFEMILEMIGNYSKWFEMSKND